MTNSVSAEASGLYQGLIDPGQATTISSPTQQAYERGDRGWSTPGSSNWCLGIIRMSHSVLFFFARKIYFYLFQLCGEISIEV
jgi:hypothetical protein